MKLLILLAGDITKHDLWVSHREATIKMSKCTLAADHKETIRIISRNVITIHPAIFSTANIALKKIKKQPGYKDEILTSEK